MTSSRYLAAVAAHLSTRLHRGAGGRLCRCGACRHLLVATARRVGCRPAKLAAALGLTEAPPPEQAVPSPRRRGAAPVVSAMTVSRAGDRLNGTEALLALVAGDR